MCPPKEIPRGPPEVTERKFIAVFLFYCAKLDMLKMSPSLFRGTWLEGGRHILSLSGWLTRVVTMKLLQAGSFWMERALQDPSGSLHLEADSTG